MSADLSERIVEMLPRLRAFARALAKAPDRADDLVQATCEKALRASDQWTPGTRLDSWLYRIMQNQWIDETRRQRPDVPIDGDEVLELAGEDGRPHVEARSTLSAVAAAIDCLPAEQRAVLTLVCLEDMSYREAAEITGVPIGTVMSRLARARTALAERITRATTMPAPGPRAQRGDGTWA